MVAATVLRIAFEDSDRIQGYRHRCDPLLLSKSNEAWPRSLKSIVYGDGGGGMRFLITGEYVETGALLSFWSTRAKRHTPESPDARQVGAGGENQGRGPGRRASRGVHHGGVRPQKKPRLIRRSLPLNECGPSDRSFAVRQEGFTPRSFASSISLYVSGS